MVPDDENLPLSTTVVDALLKTQSIVKFADSFRKKTCVYCPARPYDIPENVKYPVEHDGVCPELVHRDIIALEVALLRFIATRFARPEGIRR